ncbi:hypothetical protein K1719_021368 [Acacia pycnantha]|nr:hypothetical protein K1719_021368 [Acacia pycnantha]
MQDSDSFSFLFHLKVLQCPLVVADDVICWSNADKALTEIFEYHLLHYSKNRLKAWRQGRTELDYISGCLQDGHELEHMDNPEGQV